MSYAKPDSLVSTEWLAENLKDPNLRIVESDEDVLLSVHRECVPEGSAALVEPKAESWFRRELRVALTQAAFVFTGVPPR